MRKDVDRAEPLPEIGCRAGALSPRPLRRACRRNGLRAKKVYAQKKVTVKYTWLAARGRQRLVLCRQAYWSKAGIDVVIEKGTGSAAATQAIARASTSSASRPPNFDPAGGQGPAAAVARLLQLRHHHGRRGTAGIAIKEPADLKGKKVGSTLTSGEYPSCRRS